MCKTQSTECRARNHGRFRRGFALCTLFFALVLSPQPAIFAAGLEVWPRLETRHFLVIAEPTPHPQPVSLADWDAILRQYIEQLDAKLAPLFGGRTPGASPPTPGQKPILLICANKASYLRQLGEYGVADPATVGGSGGYYHPDANIILIWRQPTDYYSRHVVLHEVAHWYCLQLLGLRYGRMPLWLCEGLADHAAFHTWDGQTLQAMRLPRVSLENYPARLDALLKRFPQNDAGEISPESVLRCFGQLQNERNTDAPYNEYALAWGLAAYLIDGFPREMARFFASLRQNDMQESWQSAFDDAVRPTWPRFADWSAAQQRPWQWVWNHWEDTGTQLLGLSDSTALIVQNRVAPKNEAGPESGTTLLRCEVVPQLDGTVVGLVFRYESDECFEMMQFRHVGSNEVSWRHVRFAQKQWEVLSPWQKIATTAMSHVAGRGAILEIRGMPSPDGQELRFLYNDHRVAVLPFPGNDDENDNDDTDLVLPFGLAVQSGVAQFRIDAQQGGVKESVVQEIRAACVNARNDRSVTVAAPIHATMLFFYGFCH